MKSKNALRGFAIAVVLQLGVLAGFAQTNIYLYSGSETNITLNPGTYIITAYGAPGGGTYPFGPGANGGGLGAEMSVEFNFSTPTNLTLLVGGGGGAAEYADSGGGGGGGGSFVVEDSTPLVIAGGGGGGNNDYLGGNGTNSANGQGGGPYLFRSVGPEGGAGGTNGGGGAGGTNLFEAFGGATSPISGGGGGGFLGNGGNGFIDDNGYSDPLPDSGGYSFENGGYGGGYSSYGYGGYGGGGAGAAAYSDEDGSGGGGGGYSGGGGGGVTETHAYGGGGGGCSIIGSSAITILTEVSGIASPDNSTNGEIIITAVPTPLAITTDAAIGFTNGVFGFNVIGPSGSNVMIQASTDLQTWIPVQTNLLGSGPLYFSDSQSATNVQRFYRVQFSP